FGAVSLLVLLAIAAAVPGLNLVALGYVLFAEGNVARSGKLRHALPLAPAGARLGSIVLGVTLWLVPLWYLADWGRDARLIAPRAIGTWLAQGLLAGAAVLVALHLLLALARGGRLARFLWPIGNLAWLRGRWRCRADWDDLETSIRGFVADLHLGHL